MCERLAEIENETTAALGKEKSHFFVEVANDWIEFVGAIEQLCPEAKRHNSVVYFVLQFVFKDVCWFRFLFVGGNYPLLQRSLRHVWELIFRAYYADRYVAASLADRDSPSLDEKMDWLEQKENKLTWESCVKPTLVELLSQTATDPKFLEHFYDLWKSLNQHVHPSMAVAERLISPTPLFAADHFDKDWAEETYGVAVQVFDLIWLAVISSFPECADELAARGVLDGYLIVSIALRQMRVPIDTPILDA